MNSVGGEKNFENIKAYEVFRMDLGLKNPSAEFLYGTYICKFHEQL